MSLVILLSILWSDSDRDKPCYLRISCLLLLFWRGLSDEQKVYKYLKDAVAYGHVLSPAMYIIVKFLIERCFSHYKYLCVTLHPSSGIGKIPCFMVPPPDLLCHDTYNFPWDATSLMLSFTDIPKFIQIITKMDILLANQGVI